MISITHGSMLKGTKMRRDDYFTLRECRDMLGVTHARLHEIMAADAEFPLIRVGGLYIVLKWKFFAWYEQQRNRGFHTSGRNRRINNERNAWMEAKRHECCHQ